MHLGDGCGGQWLGVHVRKDAVDGPPQLLLNRAANHAEVHCRGLIQAALKLEYVLSGEERGRGGDELAQFDVRCAQ